MILLVEDSATCRAAVEAVLATAGYIVVTAATGAQALEILRRGDIDLVILDLLLPDVSGNEILEEVMRGPRVPVVVLSAELGELRESLRHLPAAIVNKSDGPEAILASARKATGETFL